MKNKTFLYGSIIFIFALILRLIKVGSFSLSHDEMVTVNSTDSLAKAIEQSRIDIVPPFLNVANVIFKFFGHGSIFWQKFPMVLAGALAVFIFYKILVYFKFRWSFLLALIPATSFILIFYSEELRPYSFILLFTLITIFWSWKAFVEGKVEIWETLLLVTSFLFLPIIHYFSFFHILALDISLLIFILIFSHAKLKKLFTLFYLNLFSFFILIPWADSFARNLRESKDIDVMKQLIQLNFDLLKNIFYKFSGGAGWWSIFILLIIIGSIIYLIFKIIRNHAGQITQSPDYFVLFNIFYLIIFLITFSQFSFGRFLFWRYLIFLIWPFFIILSYGLSSLLSGKKIYSILGFIIFGAIMLSNIINSSAYLLAPNRFTDWKGLAEFIKQQEESNQKTQVILHNFGNLYDLNFYLKENNTNIPVENITNPAIPVGPIDKMKQWFSCCVDDIIYIHIQDKDPQTGGDTKDNKTIEDMAANVFQNHKPIGQSKYLDFLNKRKIDPYWGYPFGFGGYLPPVVYW